MRLITWEDKYKVKREYLHKELAELRQLLREEDSPIMKKILEARIVKTEHQIKSLKYKSFQ